MRDDQTSRLLARCYGLVLGLAAGAFICTVPVTWRDAVAATCWMANAEAGLVVGASCPGLPGFDAAAGGPAPPGRVAALGIEPPRRAQTR